MVSVFVPILYLVVLIGGLGTFSYYYRKRLLKQSAESKTLMEEWFPQHITRDIYYSLQNMVDDEQTPTPKDGTNGGVTSGMLKSALLLRAVEDIKRLQSVQARRAALNLLMQRGASAGAGDFASRFAQLEEEMKAEVVDVAQEAEALQPGWNAIIFATASEMVANEKSRMRLGQIMPMAKQERAEWEAAQAGLKE
ncbi:Sec62/63 complex, subunit Sec66, partial [Protomyces lactucae-debilis]